MRILHILVFFFISSILLQNINAQSFMEIDLRLYDIAYNPITDKIYGVHAGDTYFGNSILVINPKTGNIEDIIPVGFEPSIIRFSPTFKFLYIGYIGLNQLHRYNIESSTLDTILIRNKIFSNKVFNYYVNEILPIPNDEDLLIVGFRNDCCVPETDGISVFKNGIEAPKSIAFDESRSFAYHEGTGYIYGYGHAYSSSKLIQYKLNDNGIEVNHTFDLLRRHRNEIEIVDDLLYGQTGEVIDIGEDIPIQIANYYDSIPMYYNHGVMEVDPINKNIYNVELKGGKYYLNIIDGTYYSLISSSLIANLDYIPQKLINLGGNGRFALMSHSSSMSVPLKGSLVLINANLSCPITNIQITGDSEVCENTKIQLKADGFFYKYIWSNGMIGKTIEVEIEENLNISVEAFDINGCKVAQSDLHKIKAFKNASVTDIQVENSPTSAVIYKCYNKSINLKATSDDADYFIWSTGNTNSEITVSKPGNYSVLAFNDSGCSDNIPLAVKVDNYSDTLPKAIISNSDTISICFGDSIKLSSHSSLYKLEWFPNNIISHEISAYNSGEYKVRTMDDNGCYGVYSDPFYLIVNPIPPTPQLFQYDTLMYTDYAGLKEWYLNGQTFNDYSADTIIANVNGIYSIRSKSSKGCYSAFSNVGIINTAALNLDTIMGKVFVDYNKNGMQDAGDHPLANQKIVLNPNNNITYSNSLGRYNIYTSEELVKLNVVVDTSIWQVTKGEPGYQIDLANNFDSLYVFSISPKRFKTEINLNLQTGLTRCNENANAWIFIGNKGTNKFTGEVCIEFDPKILKAKVDNAVLDPMPKEHCWEIENFDIGTQKQYYIELHMPSEKFVGMPILTKAYIKSNDTVLVKNEIKSILRCAVDPNDKLVSPFWNGKYALISDTLQYTIRFQNTGNDTAYHVKLKDNLSAIFNWNSFSPISASHDYQLKYSSETGHLQVDFNNIMLPDSSVNYANSQGYFSFHIFPKENISENDIVENSAQIFFDHNRFVETNIVNTTFVSNLDNDNDGFYFWNDCNDSDPNINPDAIEIPNNGIDEDCDGEDLVTYINDFMDSQIKIYPNPTNKYITIEQSGIQSRNIRIINLLGNVLYDSILLEKNQIDISDFPNGIYCIYIYNEKNVYTSRMIKHK